jgi:hypothetical protein
MSTKQIQLAMAVARYGRQFVKHEITAQMRKAKAGTIEGRTAAAAALRCQLGEARTPAKRLKLMNRIARIEAGLK